MRILTFVWFSLNILAIVVFLFSPGDSVHSSQKRGSLKKWAEGGTQNAVRRREIRRRDSVHSSQKEGLSTHFAEERQPEEMGRLRMNSVPVHSDRRNPPVGSKETSERQPNSSLRTPRRILRGRLDSSAYVACDDLCPGSFQLSCGRAVPHDKIQPKCCPAVRTAQLELCDAVEMWKRVRVLCLQVQMWKRLARPA
jgi:hypothetical protein